MNNAEEEIDEAVAQVRPWGGFEDLYPSLPCGLFNILIPGCRGPALILRYLQLLP
jgi:hypothetical protein